MPAGHQQVLVGKCCFREYYRNPSWAAEPPPCWITVIIQHGGARNFRLSEKLEIVFDYEKQYRDGVSSTETPTLEAPRRCGFTQCRQPLEYDGRGRPPEYCPDRRWPDGRTCRQAAAAERAAERATGMDVTLDAFRAAGERFLPAAQTIGQRLAEVVSAVDQVRDGALARTTAAERAASDALTQAKTADEARESALAERDRALAAAAAATAARDQAAADRDEAIAAAARADQRAEAARSDAESRVAAAWRAVADADHARGVAETEAATQATSATEHAQRREEAERRAAAADTRVTTLADQLAEATTRIRNLSAAADQARAEREAAGARLAASEERAEIAERKLAASRDRHVAAERVAESLRGDLASRRAEVAAAIAGRDEARARAAAAENRLDLLITAVGARASGSEPGTGDAPGRDREARDGGRDETRDVSRGPTARVAGALDTISLPRPMPDPSHRDQNHTGVEEHRYRDRR